jgi:hypothetical protein
VDARKRVKLFLVGVLLGVGMFLLGGVAVVPAHGPPQTVAQLQPWLLKTMCDYPAVDCTSRGAVVTSPSTFSTPAPAVR